MIILLDVKLCNSVPLEVWTVYIVYIKYSSILWTIMLQTYLKAKYYEVYSGFLIISLVLSIQLLLFRI